MGDATAPVQIIEFSDFQCPFCKQFDSTAIAVQLKYPRHVTRIFVHFPLTIHPFAKAAGQAAECAGAQGRFASMHSRLFALQDSIGKRPWLTYAREAGVPNGQAFMACMTDAKIAARIDSAEALARRLNLPGTPSVFVNGWRIKGGPTPQLISETVEAIIAGKKPPASKRRPVPQTGA
jgi:protein-disulfide isomerase